jgi:hypothetical protein
VTDYHDRIDL